MTIIVTIFSGWIGFAVGVAMEEAPGPGGFRGFVTIMFSGVGLIIGTSVSILVGLAMASSNEVPKPSPELRLRPSHKWEGDSRCELI
jgi:hypothetical protein